ncbi:hypothetical protein N665_0138s0020 [Sinapis alba]|nr:hypothetical protein N665_0138s0020 [Sinapis alba]
MMSNYEYNPLGRIWLVWRPEVRITPFYKSDQLITVSVEMNECVDMFFYTVIYAKNLESERKELWEDLKNHHNSPIIRQKPWMVAGDFNEILNMEEHSLHETDPIISHGMQDFQNTAVHCSLSDLASHGPLFTWTNKREEGLISKKLDRVLTNDHWIRLFPHSYNVFEGGGCSDHLRCRFHLRPETHRPKRPLSLSMPLLS